MQVLDNDAWAEATFGSCELGDARRTQRAVRLAKQIIDNPGSPTPRQTVNWGDCKAAYRLFSQEDVSFERLCMPHWLEVRASATKPVLLINDTTEFSFSMKRTIEGLSRAGTKDRQGFHLHSSLMVDPETGEVHGIAGAEIFGRKRAPKKETRAQQKTRPRESEVWGRIIDMVGPPPDSAKFIHVCDAGADNFEVFCHLLQQQCGWVVRLCQNRKVLTSDGEMMLKPWLEEQPLAGTYELKVGANKNQPARTAQLECRFAKLNMLAPRDKTSFVKESGVSQIEMHVVEVREVNPPAGVKKPVRWLLSTSEPVDSFEDAWKIIEWYEKRPIIENYHKCLKTGCNVENRLYRSGEKLQRMLGIMSIVAARLLQLKHVSRMSPEQKASSVVPKTWLEALRVLRERDKILTVRDFFRSLAKQGGFLGRKHDGEPGWITIWRGMADLILAVKMLDAVPPKRCG